MSRMSSVMGQIEQEHPELFALEFGKIAEYDCVYTLASTNIKQSAPNGKNYLPFILKTVIFDFVYTLIICKYRPVSTKPGQNIYVQQNLNKINHGSNWNGTTGVICS